MQTKNPAKSRVFCLCPGRDSNPHEVKPQRILSPLRLPIPPPGQKNNFYLRGHGGICTHESRFCRPQR